MEGILKHITWPAGKINNAKIAKKGGRPSSCCLNKRNKKDSDGDKSISIKESKTIIKNFSKYMKKDDKNFTTL